MATLTNIASTAKLENNPNGIAAPEGFYQQFLLLTALALPDLKRADPGGKLGLAKAYDAMYAPGATPAAFQTNATTVMTSLGMSPAFVNGLNWAMFDPEAIKALGVLMQRNFYADYDSEACLQGMKAFTAEARSNESRNP